MQNTHAIEHSRLLVNVNWTLDGGISTLYNLYFMFNICHVLKIYNHSYNKNLKQTLCQSERPVCYSTPKRF